MYKGYPRGSIGEVSVDATRLTTFDPNTTFDFMSYCDPLWVSPWTYQQLSAEIFRAEAQASVEIRVVEHARCACTSTSDNGRNQAAPRCARCGR